MFLMFLLDLQITAFVGAAVGDGRIRGFTREHFLLCTGLLILGAIWMAVNTVHHVMIERQGEIL